MKLTIHFHPVPRLIMNGAVPVRLSWPGQGKLDLLPLPLHLVMALLISPVPREEELAPLILTFC